MGQLYGILEPTFKEVPKKAYIMAAAALLIVFADSVLKEKGKDAITLLEEQPLALRWLLYFVMIFLILGSFNFAVGAGGFMYANY